MSDIDLTGVEPAVLLKHLHAGTLPLGLGALQDIKRGMTTEEARAYYARQADVQNPKVQVYFDYVMGRPIKVAFEENGTKVREHSARLYDRDAGEGAFQRALAAAKAECEALKK